MFDEMIGKTLEFKIYNRGQLAGDKWKVSRHYGSYEDRSYVLYNTKDKDRGFWLEKSEIEKALIDKEFHI